MPDIINGGKHATLAEALGDARPGDFVTITGEVPTASIEAYLLKPPRCKKCDAPFIEVPTGQRTSTVEDAGHGISRVTHIIETTYAPGCDCA